MNVKDFKKGCGFIVEGVSFVRLCDRLAQHPDVTFTDRQRFFASAADIRGEFDFRGHLFKVAPWDMNDSIFISPKDQNVDLPEIAELRDYLMRSKS